MNMCCTEVQVMYFSKEKGRSWLFRGRLVLGGWPDAPSSSAWDIVNSSLVEQFGFGFYVEFKNYKLDLGFGKLIWNLER